MQVSSARHVPRLTWIFLFIFLGSGFLASLQAGGAPGMVLREPLLDSQEVWEGQTIERVYAVSNKGDQPLEIRKVTPGCGCTVASFDKVIPPGEAGRITLQVDTKGFAGLIRENARIYSNDPVNPELLITVTAFVKPVITLSQRYVTFNGKGDESLAREIEIVGEMEKPLKLTPLSFNLDGKLTYSISEIEKGKKFRVQFKNLQGNAENFRGFLKLRTNYLEKPEVTIWIWGRASTTG